MKISGAIFDADGTLLNSMHIWNSLADNYLKARGITPEPGLREKIKTLSVYDGVIFIKKRYGLADNADKILMDINNMIEDFYFNHALPKEGVVEFLKMLKEKDVQMCIATATDRHLITAALKRNGLTDFFGEIFTCSEVGYGKNNSKIFETAADFLGADRENIWVFEDAAHAISTAKDAGFKVCAIYDQSEKDQSTVKNKSDIYICSFKEVAEHFCS